MLLASAALALAQTASAPATQEARAAGEKIFRGHCAGRQAIYLQTQLLGEPVCEIRRIFLRPPAAACANA
jgi:hypothetical protein